MLARRSPNREVHNLAITAVDLIDRGQLSGDNTTFDPYGGLETAFTEYGIGDTTVRIGTVEDRSGGTSKQPDFHIVTTEAPTPTGEGFTAEETTLNFRTSGFPWFEKYKAGSIEEGVLSFDHEGVFIKAWEVASPALAKRSRLRRVPLLTVEASVLDRERSVQLAHLLLACDEDTRLARNHGRMTRYGTMQTQQTG